MLLTTFFHFQQGLLTLALLFYRKAALKKDSILMKTYTLALHALFTFVCVIFFAHYYLLFNSYRVNFACIVSYVSQFPCHLGLWIRIG